MSDPPGASRRKSSTTCWSSLCIAASRSASAASWDDSEKVAEAAAWAKIDPDKIDSAPPVARAFPLAKVRWRA